MCPLACVFQYREWWDEKGCIPTVLPLFSSFCLMTTMKAGCTWAIQRGFLWRTVNAWLQVCPLFTLQWKRQKCVTWGKIEVPVQFEMFNQSLWVTGSKSVNIEDRIQEETLMNPALYFFSHWIFVAVVISARYSHKIYLFFFNSHSSSAREISRKTQLDTVRMQPTKWQCLQRGFLVLIDSQFRPTAQSYKGRSRPAIY